MSCWSIMKSEIEISDAVRRQIQLIQLEMLIEFDRICRKYRIPYSLDGGTFLGAVRHKGFIPWDPDIDVIMLREDYERFFVISKSELDTTKYFLQDYRTDKYYRWGYSKIRRLGTEFIRTGQEHMKMMTGIFIDVFALDNVPNNKVIRLIHKAFCYCCRRIMWSEVGKETCDNLFLRVFYQILYKIPRSFIFNILNFVCDKCNSKETELVRYMTYPYIKKLYGSSKKYFDNLSEYSFEGHRFLAFEDYNSYLTLMFGDYMTLPPVEKRKSHLPISSIKLIDMDVSVKDKDLQ